MTKPLRLAAMGGKRTPVYIEDVFSTYLYTAAGATQTITNGIDLSTKGGLVWIKNRSGSSYHFLNDTARGATKCLRLPLTDAEFTDTGSFFGSFTSTGFTTGSYWTSSIVSWTFREQAKFFDVVTYTGTGANRTIAHNLGSTPGCIIVKRTDLTSNWQVYHNSLSSAANSIQLNLLNAQASAPTVWNSTAPTSSVFSVGTDATVNASGGTYVAYIFAHNAGGFGLTGTDNVISCGSFYAVQSGSDVPVNLGFEPQFVLLKNIDSSDDWRMYDSTRGMPTSPGSSSLLRPSQSAAEFINTSTQCYPTSTGFVWAASTGLGYTGNQIYIAIRRGPMKVPTTGTSVFGLNARTGTGVNATVTGSAGVTDAVLIKNRGASVADVFASRLTDSRYLVTSTTSAETTSLNFFQTNPWDVMDGVKVGTTSTATNASANTFINYLFSRAPGFMDVVCYTGTGTAGTKTHNLRVVPEFMIVRNRLSTANNDWPTYHFAVGNTKSIALNSVDAPITLTGFWNNTDPTASVFTTGNSSLVNTSSASYIAYLFATCPGVSKVGSYTGTGTTLQINCGFTGGARFVLIKRTDASGGWHVWDTARGIVSGNDSYFVLNLTAAEVTTTDWVDAYSAGFELSNTAGNAVNVNTGTYIFLAIA